jgi:hypothetical protein
MAALMKRALRMLPEELGFQPFCRFGQIDLGIVFHRRLQRLEFGLTEQEGVAQKGSALHFVPLIHPIPCGNLAGLFNALN